MTTRRRRIGRSMIGLGMSAIIGRVVCRNIIMASAVIEVVAVVVVEKAAVGGEGS